MPKEPKEIDFEQEFGVNAGYVEAIFEQWLADPSAVDPTWSAVFEPLAGAAHKPAPAPAAPAAALPQAPLRAAAPPAAGESAPVDTERDTYQALRGVPARIAGAMQESLEIPTATSVRTLPVKVLEENRAVLNEHMRVRVLGKASFTHLIAFALARALSENPRIQSAYEEHGGKPYRRQPRAVNLGLAVDVPQPDGSRALLVPNLKNAAALSFPEFHAAYEELVRRARAGKLDAADFQHTTVTLTNPGGFGTSMSVPRLMKGQGMIVATGSIGLGPEAQSMSAAARARLALAPVMTVTATYDHRVIQGAESGLLLQRLEALLLGADGFYEDVFSALRVPWRPFKAGVDESPDNGNGGVDEGEKQAKAWKMIHAYRVRGSHLADLDPLEYKPDLLPSLDPSSYGFTIWDLDREFLTGDLAGKARMTLREILSILRQCYCRRWSVEYMHIIRRDRMLWMRDRIELQRDDVLFDAEHQQRILSNLYRAQNFERFLHTAYVGNKRFSLEGAEALIAALAELLDLAAEKGVEKVVIGMAHRGRLNVLANILNKSTSQIFDEFESVLLPLSAEGSGDVKYHLGQRGKYTTPSGRTVEVHLAANPSHLEAVDPVVCGLVRGLQDELGDAERKRVLGVLLHGDAAFSGQGVTAETLNMSALRAFESGGTIHVVVNNQIGFTAGPRDLRSTYYCTDIAKGIQAPILHANGDYPEAVLRSIHVAVDYQRQFGKDVVLDMVCYRRWGHNEGDEPAYTQPLLYARIKDHPTVVETYTDLLVRRGDMTREEAASIGERFDAELRRALETSRSAVRPALALHETIDIEQDDPRDWVAGQAPETGVPLTALLAIVDASNKIPDGFVTHPNLLRQLRRREAMVRGELDVDWGCAEALAFGTLLQEGVSVRLEGQDSGRGTFSHRHAVIRDQLTEAEYVPLRQFAGHGSRFEVWDSLLSEEAALAFEYGYAIARPGALVLWEAQFGDFANGAQIPIDQFIISGEAKWKQLAGLVLLLPHGFDGQGPEHSSARPERFLAACSDGNVTVANCTTPAQLFHLLRRQGRAQEKRPLVVFTPKSLLRDKRAASPIALFGPGARFHELLPEGSVEPRDVKRVVLSSGKVHYDLLAKREESGARDVALLRVEQLYPFPIDELRAELARYPAGARAVWCQEEPRNMGAWPFLEERLAGTGVELAYAGRPRSASPATGSHARHQAEQAHLIERAFG